MRNILFLLAFCLTFIFVDVKAQQGSVGSYVQPIQEVFQTELVYPQEKNEIQLTTAPTFLKFHSGNGLDIPFKAEYGITDSWQVECEWIAYQNTHLDNVVSKGVSDLQLGTKHSFMNIKNLPIHAAIGVEVDIPLSTDNSNNEKEEVELEPYAIFAVDFPELNNSQLFAHVGLGISYEGSSSKEMEFSENEANELCLNGGVFIPVKPFVFTSEINWNTNTWDNGNDNQLYYTPGIVWDAPGGWEFGLGIPIGLNPQSDGYRVIAMLTFEFNLFEDED